MKLLLGLALLLATLAVFSPLLASANLAAGRPTIQSSTPAALGSSSNAVDGSEKTSSITDSADRQWWEVDLGAVFPVHSIMISGKLSNFWVLGSKTGFDKGETDLGVLMSQSVFAETDVVASAQSSDFNVKSAKRFDFGALKTQFRYLRIQLSGVRPLILNEVGVFTSSCGKTHPRVGQKTDLVSRFHNVSGTATIVDDCTIIVRGFSFDSDVSLETRVVISQTPAVVEGTAGMIHAPNVVPVCGPQSIPISANLATMREDGYRNETLVLSVRLDKYDTNMWDTISVCCLPVWIDFGSGVFPPLVQPSPSEP